MTIFLTLIEAQRILLARVWHIHTSYVVCILKNGSGTGVLSILLVCIASTRVCILSIYI